jgi:hypothetical protein
VTDRDALRELVVAYATGVDRRHFDDVAALFTPEGRLLVHDASRRGPTEIATALRQLERYDRTFHFLGQQTVAVEGDRATGETYCLAHQLEGGGARILAIRYQDTFVRTPAGWRIEERRLEIDWERDQ